ncbi:VCBS domain-containing protein, partial [Kordiimonas laminariae]|uniref:VCBS domain-containing protein n=1 Tax=Kordiimonas laminariae TaxID=2917717 RepID=UPI001FF43701
DADVNVAGDVVVSYQSDTGDGNGFDIQLRVLSFNAAPEIINTGIPLNLDSTEEDTSIVLTPDVFIAGVTDPDGDDLSVTSVSIDPAFGSITDNGDGTFTYTPSADFHGDDIDLTFTVEDGNGGTVTGEATIDVTSVTDAVEDTATTDENTAVSVNVLDNDTFSGTTTLSSATLQDPSQGTLSFDADGTVSFTPAGELAADESITVVVDTVIANGGADETSTVTITVNGFNDVAVIGGDQTGAVTEDDDPDSDGLLEVSGQLTVSDVDGTAEESFVSGTFSGAYGELSLDAAGNWIYVANNAQSTIQNLDDGESLTDIIAVSSVDGTQQDISVTIAGVDDPNQNPTANNVSVATDEDGAVSGNLSASDPDGDPLIYSLVGGASVGSLNIANDGSFTFDPGNDLQQFSHGATATVSFTYQVSDGRGGVDQATLSIRVTGVNDAAIISGDQTGEVTEDSDPDGDGLLETGGQLTISDIDGDNEESFTLGTFSGTYGSLSLDAAGNWSYAASNGQSAIQNLDSGESLTDSISVRSVDGTQQTINVTIAGVDEPILPPPAPGTPDLLASSDRGVSSSDNITNDATPTFSINVSGQEVGTVIELREGSTVLASRALTLGDVANGSINLTSSGLTGNNINGIDHQIRAVASDNGLSTSSGSITVTVDTVAPVVTIDDSISGIADGSVTFTFSFNEQEFGFASNDVSVSGGATSGFDGASVVVTPPVDASGVISVSVANGSFTDRAGNGGVGDAHNQGFNTELPNNAPTLVNLDVTTEALRGGRTVSDVTIARIDANDLDGDFLLFTLNNVFTTPSETNTSFTFVQLDDDSAVIRASGEPVTAGFYSIEYTVSDGNGGSFDGSIDFQVQGEIFDGGFFPIVLDLDGDGIELIDNHSFDVDGDGELELTGFVGPDDGLLALDRDGNGIIDRGAEISFIDDLPGAETDLEGLRAFDTNGDGILDSSDDQFDEFLVFQDLNDDGIGEADELSGLTELGITSIDLTGTPTGEVLDTSIATGAILNTTTFTRADGTVGEVGDVVFATFDLTIELL